MKESCKKETENKEMSNNFFYLKCKESKDCDIVSSQIEDIVYGQANFQDNFKIEPMLRTNFTQKTRENKKLMSARYSDEDTLCS